MIPEQIQQSNAEMTINVLRVCVSVCARARARMCVFACVSIP